MNPEQKPQVSALQGLEWICLFAMMFGAFLFLKGPATTTAQLIFRLCLSGFGLIGTVVIEIINFINKQKNK
jgi:hypothetical protein